MPSLKCTYAEFIEILKAHGFILARHDGTSHQAWKSTLSAETRLVIVAGHSTKADIPIGTLQSMIRQSGLPAKLFRK